MPKQKGERLIANNKKAYFDYFIDEKFEAGIELHRRLLGLAPPGLPGEGAQAAVMEVGAVVEPLHPDLPVRERDGVVSGFRALARLVVGRLRAAREDADVGVVGTAAAGIVRLREHGDRLVVVGVSGAVFPAAPAGVGPRRHDAERIGRGRKAVSVARRTDERVDG